MLVLAEIRSMRCKRLTFGRWDENAGKQLTFGRWVEGKVYGHNESVRPRVSENGQVSDIGHFLKSARGTLPVCCVFGTAVVTGCRGEKCPLNGE